MHSLTLFRFVFFALGAVQVSLAAQPSLRDSLLPAVHRHRGISRSVNGLQPRGKKCKPRKIPKVEETKETGSAKAENSSNNDSSDNNDYPKVKGNTIQASSDRCGPSGASAETKKTSGPNGSLDWLNCGVETNKGWNPPSLKLDQIVTVSLEEAASQSGSPFKPCNKFISIFNKYGNKYNIAPIMLASFAMQESSCNAETVGGAGEQGLMQITREKCDGAPGGNCRDPDFNIKTAAKYFKGNIDNNNGDVLLSIGQYNGWNKGMTVSQAKQRWNGNCRTQRNLDYLHQFLNGWCQNINVYGGTRYGRYFNLDEC